MLRILYLNKGAAKLVFCLNSYDRIKYNVFLKIVNNDMDESIIEELINKAGEAVSKHYNDEEITAILKDDDDFEKPVAIMSLGGLNKDTALLLIRHLTGCDGRIREASAYKISEFLNDPEYCQWFLNEDCAIIIINGIMDINPNVSRNLIEGIRHCKEMQTLIFPKLIQRIENILKKLKEISASPFFENKLNDRKNHAKNKIVFNLYWALEALYCTEFNDLDDERLINILDFTSGYIDYTIREKSARIISKMKNPPNDLLHKLKNDKNFYVKNQLLC